jgi:hypothetical protein
MSRVRIGLALILMIGFVVRLWYASGQSLTFDENYELELVQGSVSYILHKGDGFPPLYALLLKGWVAVFGPDSSRLWSILLGCGCCLAMFPFTKLVGGTKAALWSTGILAVLPIHVFYSTETRAYSLLLLIATLALTSVMRTIKSPNRRSWIGFVLMATMGIYTHYLFGCFVALVLVVTFLQSRENRISSVLAALAIGALILPLMLLWSEADFAMQSSWEYRIGFGLAALGYTYGSFLMGYTLGPSLRALHGMSVTAAVQQTLPWAILIGSGLCLVLFQAKQRCTKFRQAMPLLFVFALAPLGMGLMCNVVDIGYQVRYSIWAVIPCVAYGGWLASQAWDSRLGKLGLAMLAVAFSIAIWNRHYVDDYRNADVASVAEFLDGEADMPVLVVSGYMVKPLGYYCDAAQEIVGIPTDADYANRASEMETILNDLAATSREFAFVYTREFHEDAEGKLFAQVGGRAELTPWNEFSGVKLYRAKFK